MSAVSTFIANLRQYQGTLNSSPMIGDITLFINALNELAAGSGGGSPGGSNGDVQFKSGTSFAGTNNLFWDNTNSRLSINNGIFPANVVSISANDADGILISGAPAGKSLYLGFTGGDGVLFFNQANDTQIVSDGAISLLTDGSAVTIDQFGGGNADLIVTGGITGVSITVTDGTFAFKSTASFADGAGGSTGTLTNAPSVGNPTKWVPFDDNGTTRHFPAW